MKPKNVLTTGKKHAADLAARAGDLSTAKALYAQVCQRDPADTEARIKLALVEKGLGNYAAAEQGARHALKLQPLSGYGHYALGQALHCQQHLVAAITSYRRATQLQPDIPEAHYLLGLALREDGDTTQAVSSLQQALRLRPSFAQALAEMGAAMLDLGELDTGLKYLTHAAALNPMDAALQGNICHALRLQGNSQAAGDNYRHALDLMPDNVDLMAGLAGLLNRQGAAQEAQCLLDRCLQIAPQHGAGNLVAAQWDRARQNLHAAVDRLQALLQRPHPVGLRAESMLELAQIYDQLGEPDSAYPLMCEGKRKKALLTLDGSGTNRSDYLQSTARMRALATPALGAALRRHIASGTPLGLGSATPVFLIGFPRSGTTLLEQILDSHPQVQAMEEKPAVAHLVQHALALLDSTGCTLEGLQDAQIEHLQQLYFSEVSRHVSVRPGQVLIDKMPLNLLQAPVIARVFPQARFILALRHPCDVSLSCLMQNFAVNASMANFYTLDDTAQLYAQVMQTWRHYTDQLPLNVHTLRYEDLVADLPLQSKQVLDFLGLPWDDAVLQHTAHARSRGTINTPSHHQVVQPLYQRARYRWSRYEKHMKAVLPVLRPWIDAFGYA